MQIEFEKRLAELGLPYSIIHDGFYTIPSQKGIKSPIIVQLIPSIPISKQVSGSRNGNEVQAIGSFELKLPTSGLEADILCFAFQNTIKNQVEFLIIPSKEFIKRQLKKNPSLTPNKTEVIAFWLMDDRCVYDVTNISPEGEWFFLGKGVNGRMSDGSELDYSHYFNCWQRLTAL